MKIAVIGAGNMGGAIARGALLTGTVKPEDITICDPTDTLVKNLDRQGWKVTYSVDNSQGAKEADLVVVAVKPWLVEQVMGEISGVIDRQRQAVVSIAAGVTFEQIGDYIDAERYGGPALYRVIPNTAIAIGKSVTFIASYNGNSNHDTLVHNLFAPLGEVFQVGESQMQAVTALSSSGIAYAYKYIEASAQGGVTLGLPEDVALRIVLATVDGAVAMLRHNRSEPQEEISKVTTPGGITLKGLQAMEDGGFTRAVISGLEATK
ncbi:MAG: pyrroline-5-carboxylate reductase [Rikenellaceae bacterium]|nr:pyrroline-5-carboxylate reductase [Rikenellaceae bacterium]